MKRFNDIADALNYTLDQTTLDIPNDEDYGDGDNAYEAYVDLIDFDPEENHDGTPDEEYINGDDTNG